jgi:DNA-binding response OmpR family regulator
MKVLIAEDDRVHAHLLAHQLKAQCIRTVLAYDAMQAVMLATRNELDAVLLDINMPGGTGLEVLKRLKASMKTSMIPIIAFSGGTDPGLAQAVRDLGAEEFLQKPVAFDNLFSLLCGLLHLPAPAVTAGPEKRN